MANRRASWWTRWPDRDDGPLWVGLHVNERTAGAAVVGVEIWTEAPGSSRSSLGPDAESMADDMVPWAPRAVRGKDLDHLRLPELILAMREALAGSDRDLAERIPLATGGRPVQYGPDHFERVAGVWLQHEAAPTAEVARAWSVSRATAKGWVRRARALGLLDRAPQ